MFCSSQSSLHPPRAPPSVIPTENRTTRRGGEVEWRDPDNLSRAMPHQGVLTMHSVPLRFPILAITRFWQFWQSSSICPSATSTALVQTRRVEALSDFRLRVASALAPARRAKQPSPGAEAPGNGSEATRKQRSRAVKCTKSYFLAPQARAQLLPAGPVLACWEAMQRSAQKKMPSTSAII